MSGRLANLPERGELKPLKCELRGTKESFVRGGQLFERARIAAGLSQKEAAGLYGVSASLLSRQIDNEDNQHLSFQRICEMPPRFRRELVKAMLDEIGGVRSRLVFEFEDERQAG